MPTEAEMTNDNVNTIQFYKLGLPNHFKGDSSFYIILQIHNQFISFFRYLIAYWQKYVITSTTYFFSYKLATTLILITAE